MSEHLLEYISASSILIPTVLMVSFFRVIQKKYDPLLILISVSIVTEILLILFQSRNLVIINSYTIVEFALISVLFRSLFFNRSWKIYTTASAVAFTGFALYNMYFLQGISRMNSYTLMLECAFVVSFSLMLYYQCYNRLSEKINFIYKPEFWIGAAFLIYFGGNFFIFANSYEYLWFTNTESFNIWNMHSVINIILNILLATAIWFSRKKYE